MRIYSSYGSNPVYSNVELSIMFDRCKWWYIEIMVMNKCTSCKMIRIKLYFSIIIWKLTLLHVVEDLLRSFTGSLQHTTSKCYVYFRGTKVPSYESRTWYWFRKSACSKKDPFSHFRDRRTRYLIYENLALPSPRMAWDINDFVRQDAPSKVLVWLDLVTQSRYGKSRKAWSATNSFWSCTFQSEIKVHSGSRRNNIHTPH